MIDKKALEHIATLARLKLTDQEAMGLSEQLSKVLSHFEQISQIKTDGVEPMVTPSEIQAFWREDEPKKEFTAEEMTQNAPDRLGHLFKVPPVV